MIRYGCALIVLGLVVIPVGMCTVALIFGG